MKDRSLARWAGPIAFLAAITVAVLLVRAGLHQGSHATTTATATTTTVSHTGHGPHKGKKKKNKKPAAGGQYYSVASGDTFSSIAAKLGTTSAKLEQLNPGVDPTALHVGERIRVK